MTTPDPNAPPPASVRLVEEARVGARNSWINPAVAAAGGGLFG